MNASKIKKPRKTRKQRGVALLIVIFALLLVSGIAIAMLGNSDTETGINQNYRETQQAYFAAQGGIAEGIAKIKAGTAVPTVMPSSSSTAGVVYIINKKSSTEGVTPWTADSTYADTEFCKENFGLSGVTNNGTGAPCTTLPSGSNWYTSVNSTSPYTSTSGALEYKWTRITLKSNSSSYPYFTNTSNASGTLATQVCGDGQGNEVMLPTSYTSCTAASYFPVYVLTSLAVTTRGTRRMVQREITKIKIPPLPGALTFDGPGNSFTPPYSAPNSNNFFVNGNDRTTTASGGCGGQNRPAIAVIDTPTDNLVANAIPSNRTSHYTGSGGTTPDVEVVSSTALAGWSTPAGAEAIAAQLKAAASPSNVYSTNTGNSYPNFNGLGTSTSPQITYVDGNLTMSGATYGSGILIVTGTLTMSGNSSFDGIILVIGQGTFVADGGGNGQYNGAMLVARTRDTSGHVLSTLGEPIVDWSGGGGNGIQYDSCMINNVQNGLGFRTQMTRELLY